MANGTTAKEREARRARVAELVAEGLSNSRIAKELGVSAATVKRDRAALAKAGKTTGDGGKPAAAGGSAAKGKTTGGNPAKGGTTGGDSDRGETTDGASANGETASGKSRTTGKEPEAPAGDKDGASNDDEHAGHPSDGNAAAEDGKTGERGGKTVGRTAEPSAHDGQAHDAGDRQAGDEAPRPDGHGHGDADAEPHGDARPDASKPDASKLEGAPKEEDKGDGDRGDDDATAAIGDSAGTAGPEGSDEVESEEIGDGWDSPLEEELFDDIPFVGLADVGNEAKGSGAAEPTTAAELTAKVDEQREHVDDAYAAAVASAKPDEAAPSFEPRVKAVHPADRIDHVKLAADRAAIENERRERELRNATSLRGVMREMASEPEGCEAVMDVHEWWRRFSEEQDVYYGPFGDRATGGARTHGVDPEEWDHFVSLDDAGKYRYMLRKRRDDRAATAAVIMAVIMVVSVVISLFNLS